MVVVAVSIVALALVLYYVLAPSPSGSPAGFGAETNLRDALTAVQTYQAHDHGSLDGLTTGAEGVSSIQNLNTGLSYTTTASTRPGVISIRPGVDDTFVIMAASEANHPAGCFGILYVAARQLRPVLGETKPGIYYFIQKAAAPCDASSVVPGAISTSGFPNG